MYFGLFHKFLLYGNKFDSSGGSTVWNGWTSPRARRSLAGENFAGANSVIVPILWKKNINQAFINERM
jgi:hypothetical protein